MGAQSTSTFKKLIKEDDIINSCVNDKIAR